MTTDGVTLAHHRSVFSAESSLLLVVAAMAWLVTIAIAEDMGVMPGTMGLGFIGFVGAWTLMMAAMMLMSIAPFASLYTRTMHDHRVRRVTSLTLGYLAVWAAAGVVGFGAAAGADRLATRAPGWAQATAVGTCMVCAVYQVTPLKDRCLQHCRSPLGHLVRYTSLRGPLVDARVGLSHGGWCLGCCWALMLLLITFGVMNLIAMVVLATVIVVEKVLAPGRWFSIAIGAGAFAFGIAIWIHPSVAGGLYVAPSTTIGGM